jgi:acetyl esterase/lipase
LVCSILILLLIGFNYILFVTGWNGKKLVMTGDSAGGNLIVSFTLKMIELNALRLPDGLVPIYTPFLFQYLPAPSRVLSFADPLLHMGVVIRCAAGTIFTFLSD